MKGYLNPGARLVENDLVQTYGFTRGQIREAFHYLEKDGFINIIPNKGAVIAGIRIEEVKDLYTVLIVMEGQAVEWACPKLSEADLQELSTINRSLIYWADHGEKVDLIKWHEINGMFHNYIGIKSGSAKLVSIIKDIRKRLFRLRYWSIVSDTYDDYHKGHEEIISSLRQGDAAGARKAMENHVMQASEIHMDLVSHYK